MSKLGARDEAADLQRRLDLLRDRDRMGVAEDRIPVLGEDELRRPAGRRGDEGDAADRRLVDGERRVLDDRRHDRQAVSAEQVLQRLELLEFRQDVDLARPVARDLLDIAQNVLVHACRQTRAGLAHEADSGCSAGRRRSGSAG